MSLGKGLRGMEQGQPESLRLLRSEQFHYARLMGNNLQISDENLSFGISGFRRDCG
jgi:hypothetical protein